MNIAIVTGASSGMGKEMVLQIARKYSKLDEIWVVARRKERLEELEACCKIQLRIIAADLCQKEGFGQLEDTLYTIKPNVRLLANCAGVGYLERFDTAAREIWEHMVDLNCKTLVSVTHLVLPFMKNGARILEFASASAFVPQPGFNVYAASKAFVMHFSRALNAELHSRGITVTAVCPGPVRTEFFAIADPKDQTMGIKKLFMAEPQAVVAKALTDAKNHKTVSVYGGAMNLFWIFTKLVPHQVLIDFMKK